MGLKNEYRWEEAEAKKKRKHGVEISTFWTQDFRAERHVYCYGLVNCNLSNWSNVARWRLWNIFFLDFYTIHLRFSFWLFYECDGQVAFTRMCGITSWSLKESRKEVAGSFLQCEYLLAFVFFFSCYLHNECDPPSWKTIHLHPDASSADAEAKRERRSSMRGRWWGNYIAICHHLSKSSLINGKIMNMYSLHGK